MEDMFANIARNNSNGERVYQKVSLKTFFLFIPASRMAAFVAEQVDLINSPLLLDYIDGGLDDTELLLLVVALEDDAKHRLLLPRQETIDRLCLEDLDDETCAGPYRFTKAQLKELVQAFGFPEKTSGRCRVSWSGMEGLLVLLQRMAFPDRLSTLAEDFGRFKAAISVIFNTTLNWLVGR